MGEVGEPSRKDSFLQRAASAKLRSPSVELKPPPKNGQNLSAQQKKMIMDAERAYSRSRKIWALQVAGVAAAVILCSILLAIFLADHFGKGGKTAAEKDNPPPPPKKTTTPPPPPTTTKPTTQSPKNLKTEPLNVEESGYRAATRGPPSYVAAPPPARRPDPLKCNGELRPKNTNRPSDTTRDESEQGYGSRLGPTTCRTRECHEIGNTMKGYMNLNMDPCTNFYEFACGRTSNLGKSEGQFDYARGKQIQMELEILNSPQQRTREPKAKALNFVKNLYARCFEAGTPEEMQAQFAKIKDIPATVLNISWPVLGSSFSQDLSKATSDLLRRLHGLPVILGVKYNVMGNDSSQWGWNLVAPTFLLTNPVLRGNLPAYTSFVAKVAKEFSDDSSASRGRFLPLASDIVDFELKLIQVLSSAENSAHAHSHIATANVTISVGQLERLLYYGNPSAQFSIKTFLKYLFSAGGMADVKDDEFITVFNMDYLKSLTKVLGETPSRTVLNYLGYRLVMVLVPLATRTRSLLSNSERTFLPVLEALTPFPTSVPGCYMFVSGYFGWILRRHAFANNFGADVARDISNIMTKIKAELRWRVEGNACFSHERLVQATEELENIEPCHNYVSSDDEVEKYYEGLVLLVSETGNYVEQVFKIFDHTNTEVFNFLRGNVTSFPYCSATPEGQMPHGLIFYSREDKKISVPLAYWREPFYYKNNIQALNFGAIGAVIGHEFMHGLLDVVPEWTDHQDPLLQTHPVSGFPPRTVPESKKSKTFLPSECVIDQYARFSSSSRGSAVIAHGNGMLNSTRTFPEDFSDIGGVKLAFSAYKKFLNENGQRNNEQRLPGLETYSPEQLFFLKFANIWCEKTPESAKERQPETKPLPPHSPNEFRVWGSLQNNADFARVWNCPIGSEMNPGPLKRCSIFE